MMSEHSGILMTRSVSPRAGGLRDWKRWTPYAAVAWSLVYAALGLYWAVSGRGFPYVPGLTDNVTGPVVGRYGPVLAWIVVIALGIPAAALGAAMLRGVRRLRPLFITAGVFLAVVLLLLMTDMTLLISLGYIPYSVVSLIRGDELGQKFLKSLTDWTLLHQVLALTGGFLWLAATVSYARLSGDACLYCGRREGMEGWTSPKNAGRWGRIAVLIALIPPVIYTATRYAWAVGIPWGMTVEHWRNGQEAGLWISGLFLANFGLVGALLMLGLTQRWGEVFPRWMIGLAGRRVPVALAVIPASIVSVLLVVGGISIISGYEQMLAGAATTGENFWIVAGPTFLFPLWGAALAVGTLGYYFRRRGPCIVCGRGVEPIVSGGKG